MFFGSIEALSAIVFELKGRAKYTKQNSGLNFNPYIKYRPTEVRFRISTFDVSVTGRHVGS